MSHWFVRWFLYGWAAPFAAVVAFAQAISFYFGMDGQLLGFMAEHRSAAGLVLIASMVFSFLREILSADHSRLHQLKRDTLTDQRDDDDDDQHDL